MATYSSLSALFQDIANEIRSVNGAAATDKFAANDFPSRINGLKGGKAQTPATTITTPAITLSWNGATVTATGASTTKSITPAVTNGYISSGTAGTVTAGAPTSKTSTITNQAAATYTMTSAGPTSVIASGTRVYFSGNYNIEVQAGAAKVAATSFASGTPTISWNANTYTLNVPQKTQTVTGSVTTNGWITSVTQAAVTALASSKTGTITSAAAKTITPTTSAQTAVVQGTRAYFAGAYVVGAISTETKSATPSTSAQTITPTSGKYLTSVTISAIPTTYKLYKNGYVEVTSSTRNFTTCGGYTTFFYNSVNCGFAPTVMAGMCNDGYTSWYINFSTGEYQFERGQAVVTDTSTTETNKWKSGNTIYLPSATGSTSNRLYYVVIG